MKSKNVILVGYMGAGKTTVGIRLSYKLKKSMIDIDQKIEKDAGRTIKEIFADDGEDFFRNLETNTIRKVASSRGSYIISTGGGLPMREENRQILKEMGLVIYLRVQPETVYRRISHDTERPLLQVEDPLAKIKEMLMLRDPVYESTADYIVDVDNRSFSEIVEEICTKVIPELQKMDNRKRRRKN